jgi:Sec-independent protein translocase protein TatA
MSDVRALRDTLAEVQRELRRVQGELEKQRARHAREQEALQRTLEETRREAARLRERLGKAEGRDG